MSAGSHGRNGGAVVVVVDVAGGSVVAGACTGVSRVVVGSVRGSVVVVGVSGTGAVVVVLGSAISGAKVFVVDDAGPPTWSCEDGSSPVLARAAVTRRTTATAPRPADIRARRARRMPAARRRTAS